MGLKKILSHATKKAESSTNNSGVDDEFESLVKPGLAPRDLDKARELINQPPEQYGTIDDAVESAKDAGWLVLSSYRVVISHPPISSVDILSESTMPAVVDTEPAGILIWVAPKLANTSKKILIDVTLAKPIAVYIANITVEFKRIISPDEFALAQELFVSHRNILTGALLPIFEFLSQPESLRQNLA